MWLVKSSWCVHCCSFHQFYWVCDRCRSEFALWWFFCPKKSRYSTCSFSFVLVLTTRHSLSFHKFERQSCLFELIMLCLLVNSTWECLIPISVFFCGIMYFFVSNCDAVFLVMNFPYLITVSDWYYHFGVLNFFHLFSSTELVVVALANLLWSVFVSIKLSQIGIFH